jgi:hypothetical protein
MIGNGEIETEQANDGPLRKEDIWERGHPNEQITKIREKYF